jgi:hypothetical protein
MPTFDAPMELEDALTSLLSRANRPLKARAIAAILSSEKQTFIHKREINPTLYRMLSRRVLCRDSEFRWYVDKTTEVTPSSTHERAPVLGTPATDILSQDNPSNEPLRDGTAEVLHAETSLPPDRNYGKFQVLADVRPYVRHCTWCSAEISPRATAIVLRGVFNRCPRFCSDDCFQGWESIYWQRVALSRLGLSKEDLKLEHRYLRRQQHFRRFR